MINRTALMTVLAASGSFAAADIVASFSFTDLNGSYSDDTGLFTAAAANDADFASGGDVSLLTGSKGTAQYDTGFFGLGSSDVSLELDISNVTASSADGVGFITITDSDGDTLTASIAGSWDIINPFGFMFFSGTSSDFTFSDNGNADGEFNGVNGSFSIASLTSQVFDGAVSLLLQNFGGFDAGSFDGVSTEADGLLIPTPGVLAIAGLGLAGMTTRRRK